MSLRAARLPAVRPRHALRATCASALVALAISAAPVGSAQAMAPSASPQMSAVTATAQSTVATRAAFVARGAKVMAIGKRYLGVPYRAGGTSPRTGFDCSGFVRYVYGKLHIHLPRVSRDQARYVHRISRSQALPGDLVFFTSGGRVYHAAIYAGRNRVLHSPHTGSHVKFERIWASSVIFGRVR